MSATTDDGMHIVGYRKDLRLHDGDDLGEVRIRCDPAALLSRLWRASIAEMTRTRNVDIRRGDWIFKSARGAV
jgi:hypothetical protein